MPKAWAIKDWNRCYEKTGSHRPDREVIYHWVAIPTKHDGKSFRRLAKHPAAVSVFCAFVLMVQVAAKMPVRGILADEDGPLDADDLADATGYPANIFTLAFNVLPDQKIGWIVICEIPQMSGVVGSSPATGEDITGQERTGEDIGVSPQNGGTTPATFLIFPTTPGKKNKAREWRLCDDYVSELKSSFRGIDVPAECNKALLWVRAKDANRKTAGGMREFLFRWMGRVKKDETPASSMGFQRRQPTPEEVA